MEFEPGLGTSVAIVVSRLTAIAHGRDNDVSPPTAAKLDRPAPEVPGDTRSAIDEQPAQPHSEHLEAKRRSPRAESARLYEVSRLNAKRSAVRLNWRMLREYWTPGTPKPQGMVMKEREYDKLTRKLMKLGAESDSRSLPEHEDETYT